MCDGKFHQNFTSKTVLKNEKFHANFTLLGRSADNCQEQRWGNALSPPPSNGGHQMSVRLFQTFIVKTQRRPSLARKGCVCAQEQKGLAWEGSSTYCATSRAMSTYMFCKSIRQQPKCDFSLFGYFGVFFCCFDFSLEPQFYSVFSTTLHVLHPHQQLGTLFVNTTALTERPFWGVFLHFGFSLFLLCPFFV